MKKFKLPCPKVSLRGKNIAHQLRFSSIKGSILSPNASTGMVSKLNTWINRAARQDTLIRAYRDKYFDGGRKPLHWGDIRIRSFTPEETDANRRWMSASWDLFMLQMMRDSWARGRRVSPLASTMLSSTQILLFDGHPRC